MIATNSNETDITRSDAPQRVQVNLDARSYEIVVGRGVLDCAGDEIAAVLGPKKAQGRTAAIVSNLAVFHRYGARLETGLAAAGFHVISIPVRIGESYKTLRSVGRIFDQLYTNAVDRRTLIVALGGGVIGDVAGFVAASYQRGLDLVQVPTTLLAQVDSSVGGKTGVNFGQAKNLIGAFHQPRLVLIDPDSLRTLPLRERRSGMAEIIKHGAIRDAAFFDKVSCEIESLVSLESDYLERAIARSCRIKAEVVESDERETGTRAVLNFGHTIGHALEAVTEYRTYRHGEAIAIGMITASLIGEEVGVTGSEVTKALLDVLRRAGFETRHKDNISDDDIIRLLALDKKSVNGGARFVLVPKIGEVTIGHAVPEPAVRSALKRQRALQ